MQSAFPSQGSLVTGLQVSKATCEKAANTTDLIKECLLLSIFHVDRLYATPKQRCNEFEEEEETPAPHHRWSKPAGILPAGAVQCGL